MAHEMFRDLWSAKETASQNQGVLLKKDIAAIDKKIDQFLERVTEADSDILITAYEKKIKELTKHKALMAERIASCGKPLKSFAETYRTAFDFLANPCKLWNSERLEDRRAVLKLVFAERLPYSRHDGYRTAKISMPFTLIGSSNMHKNGMVPHAGIEPALLSELDFESSASTSSANGARH